MTEHASTSPDFASASTPDSVPQFNIAEFVPAPCAERCRLCSSVLNCQYFVVHGQRACAVCAISARKGLPSDSHSAYLRSILFGMGGALIGSCFYAAITVALHGWTIGYFALAVGWLVGKSMTLGSGGRGGIRYQVCAALLTYAAITLKSIPVTAFLAFKNPGAVFQLGRFVPRQLLIGLASPFLRLNSNPIGAMIGLFVAFLGLCIAWQLTRRKSLPVYRPYRFTSHAR